MSLGRRGHMPQNVAKDEAEEQQIDDLDEGAEVVPVTVGRSLQPYGADYPVDGLVQRLKNGDIVIPTFDPEAPDSAVAGFQRKYVWSKRQADRFVESLLLGYPVPGIFLVRQADKRLLVLDGAQRLETVRSFYSGVFRKQAFTLDD